MFWSYINITFIILASHEWISMFSCHESINRSALNIKATNPKITLELQALILTTKPHVSHKALLQIIANIYSSYLVGKGRKEINAKPSEFLLWDLMGNVIY